MATKIPMPKFGLSMEEGTIEEWLVKEGDYISKGQAIAEINSEKLTNKAESEFEGILLKILVQEGDTVECGTPIAVIGEKGENIEEQDTINDTSVLTQENSSPDVKYVPMPKFGLSMEEGTIEEWLVGEGDFITKGQAIAEINSEKLTNKAESEFEGTLLKILVFEQETVECGTPIAIIGKAGADISTLVKVTASIDNSQEKTMAESKDELSIPAVTSSSSSEDVVITPKALKYANEHSLSYFHIKGTGIGGAITIADVKTNGIPVTKGAITSDNTLSDNKDVSITPKALKYAKDHGLSYSHIKGTGLLGMITVSDVKTNGVPLTNTKDLDSSKLSSTTMSIPEYVSTQIAATVNEGDRVEKMTSMQQVICKAMYNSIHGTAPARIMTEINVEELTKLYAKLKGEYSKVGIKLSYTAMLVKAIAMAIEKHESVRVQYVDEKHIKIINKIDIGIAVDIPTGLVVPVIRDANLKDLRQICMDLTDITNRAKNGGLTDNDFGGAVTSITNLGMFNVTYCTPVLNPPETTILGVGAIFEKPVIKNGGIYIEHVMNLSLTHDHRITNGAPCARYLKEVSDNLMDFKWGA